MFSVIMPTYNCEKYVAEAISSVLAQTYTDFELIIIDDGSSDETVNIARNFARKDLRIRFFERTHGGVSAARNTGIREARGERILFIDGDDTWSCELLEQCTRESENELVIFGIASDLYTKSGEFVCTKTTDFEPLSNDSFDARDDFSFLFRTFNIASPCNKVYNRETIVNNGITFCERCVCLEDLKFNLDYFSQIKTVKIIKRDFYHYRLFLGEKQVLKRRFGETFVNADELVESFFAFSEGSDEEAHEIPELVSVMLKNYYDEFLWRIQTANEREQKELLAILNDNKNYNFLLSRMNGKFFVILRAAKFLRLKKIQITLIRRRFWQ